MVFPAARCMIGSSKLAFPLHVQATFLSVGSRCPQLVALARALPGSGAIAGSEYNVFDQLNLPRIPVDEGGLATGALIALAIVLVATALAAVAGGKLGQRYHTRVDRAGVIER